MEQIILVIHLVVALAIIGLIMLQQGKGADMGASFGAGASQTLFGSDGSGNVLTKATAWLVVLFFASSFGLAMLANQQSTQVDDLGLDLPMAAEQAPAAEELPALEDELPVVEEDIPVATDPVEDELPSLD
jgi:preprotein translocase subunit SecG